jgi:hypothetical protein
LLAIISSTVHGGADVPPSYAASPGFYGFYRFDPAANNWDYYRVTPAEIA